MLGLVADPPTPWNAPLVISAGPSPIPSPEGPRGIEGPSPHTVAALHSFLDPSSRSPSSSSPEHSPTAACREAERSDSEQVGGSTAALQASATPSLIGVKPSLPTESPASPASLEPVPAPAWPEEGGELEPDPTRTAAEKTQVLQARPLGHLRCGNVDVAEVVAVSTMLLNTLAEAVVEKRRGEMFPKPIRTVADTSRKELCSFLDSLLVSKNAVFSDSGSVQPLQPPAQGSAQRPLPLDDSLNAKNVEQVVHQTLSTASASPSESENNSDAAAKENRDGEQVRVPQLNATTVEAAVKKTLSNAMLNANCATSVVRCHDAVQERSTSIRDESRSRQRAEDPGPSHPQVFCSDDGWIPPALQVAPLFQGHLDTFLAKQQTLFARLSSVLGATNKAAVDDVAHELAQSHLWEGNLRRDLARVLIRRLDTHSLGHCSREFLTQQELQSHEDACRFRTVECPHAPCPVNLAQMNLSHHDAACPYKPLPCAQECGEIIARGFMAVHCAGECAMRMVECPFSALSGCVCVPMRQRDLELHCRDAMQQHQQHMLASLLQQHEMVDVVHQRLNLLEKAQELHEKAISLDIRAVQVKLFEAGSKMEKVERGVTKGTSDWKQQQAALKRETQALRQQVQVLLKEQSRP